MSSQPKILLTGATGYIGGSILSTLLSSSTSNSLRNATITCLLRGEDRANTLKSAYGDRVHPVTYEGLDDTSTTTALAAQHDIIINTTLGYHTDSAVALVRGLAQRKVATGRDVWMIHTSGTSNLGDQPVSRKWVEPTSDREFDDATDAIYKYELYREKLAPYPQRTAELAVVTSGLELGVKTLVIMSPTIFGSGSGLFNTASIQIPALAQAFVALGYGVTLGDGAGVWDHVHVEDLTNLYKIVLEQILDHSGKDLPHGEKGIIFSGNGRHSWLEVAQAVSDICFQEGKIVDKTVKQIGFGEETRALAKHLLNAPDDMLELSLASNSRTLSNVGRRLGWKPVKGAEAWKEAVENDVKFALSGSSQATRSVDTK